jgi:hypothetical protein
MTTDDAKLLNTNDDKLCRKTPKVPNYLDNLEITRINAPFSSRNLVLSFFRCSNCFNSSSTSESFFTSAAKKKIETVVQTPAPSGGLTDTEKKEKEALVKKLSEMEEELKQLEHLKNDNTRLRDENGALIRVISKLSK